MEDIRNLIEIEDPVKRRAIFVAILSKEIVGKGGTPPIVVGGEALEIYTQGSYTTGDIDIISQPDELESALKDWGFIKTGRLWLNKQLDIYIDWRGGSLGEGKQPETIKIGEGLEVKVIAIEDLIIDRLNAVKWWGDTDSLMWAKVLIGIKKAVGRVDTDYLKERAKKEEIEDIMERLFIE